MEEKANRSGPFLFSSDGEEVAGNSPSKIDCYTRQNPAYRTAPLNAKKHPFGCFYFFAQMLTAVKNSAKEIAKITIPTRAFFALAQP